MSNVLVICVCFEIYFLMDHHCKISRIRQKLLKFLQGDFYVISDLVELARITNKSLFSKNVSGAGMLVTIMLLMDGLRYILPEDLKDRPRIGEQNQTYFAPEETTIYHY